MAITGRCSTSPPCTPSLAVAGAGVWSEQGRGSATDAALALAWRTGRASQRHCPGFIVTEQSARGRADPTHYQRVLDRTPAGRWGMPADIVGPALFSHPRRRGSLPVLCCPWMAVTPPSSDPPDILMPSGLRASPARTSPSRRRPRAGPSPPGSRWSTPSSLTAARRSGDRLDEGRLCALGGARGDAGYRSM